MSKRVAVLTDATSPEFWFPKWYEYYGAMFGGSNLFVLTYEGKHRAFENFDLGEVWDVPQVYSDLDRVQIIAALVEKLLQTYEVVVRCDVDEFLVPDPRQYPSLRHYLDRLEMPYVTAFGIDIFEDRGDQPLDQTRRIIHVQRQKAVVNSALHKTSITQIPIKWAPGFHAANVAPRFNNLFLLHTKFCDLDSRITWFKFMKSKADPGGSEYQYFSYTENQFREHKGWLSQKMCRDDGWNVISSVKSYTAFLNSVTIAVDGIQQGEFVTGDETFLLPAEFRDLL